MEVTPEKAKELIMQHCDRQINGSLNFFSFFSGPKEVSLSFTRIIEPWEKDANLALPSHLKIHGGCIDKAGVTVYKELSKWDEFALTAIATHIIPNRAEGYDYTYYFMGCLKNAEIINKELLDAEKYSNLLGHFIELYKANS